MWKVGVRSRDRPKSLNEVVTAPLPNARQQLRVLRVLGGKHFKWMTRVNVGLAHLINLTAQWP